MHPAYSQGVSRELILIGGAYKSGTSRLCDIIEGYGYANPASITNPLEHGHGVSVQIYQTRECSVARKINKNILSAGVNEQMLIERQIGGYLLDMWQAIGGRLVVKDPCMKLTASHWVRVASMLGTGRITFLLTARDPSAILRSWKNSQFLTREQNIHHERFRRLLAPLHSSISGQLTRLEVAMVTIPFEQIVPTQLLGHLEKCATLDKIAATEHAEGGSDATRLFRPRRPAGKTGEAG